MGTSIWMFLLKSGCNLQGLSQRGVLRVGGTLSKSRQSNFLRESSKRRPIEIFAFLWEINP